MSPDLVVFERAKRGDPPVRCLHCGGELEAVGEYGYAVARAPRWFAWRHVETQSVTCTTIHDAEVRNDWQATAQIEHADTG